VDDVIMRKNPHAVALGRRGGLIGGKSKSIKKQRASRRNGKLNKGRLQKKNIDKSVVGETF